MLLVMGITGRTGGSVASHLLAQGKRVRALVRDRSKAADWATQGVELITGDWDDADAIALALDGVEGAFIMLPPIYMPSRDFSESWPLIAAYAKALKTTPLPRLVVLSSNGAEKTSGLGAITPLSLLEQELANLPYPHAYLRAGSFYENYVHGLRTARDGTFSVFYKNTGEKYPMTGIKDIGAAAAKLLTGPVWTGKHVIELGSMVSPHELATALGDVLGRDVKAESVPREAWAFTLEQMGFPSDKTWAFEEIYDGSNSHWIGFGVRGAQRIEGATTAREVFAAAKKAAQG